MHRKGEMTHLPLPTELFFSSSTIGGRGGGGILLALLRVRVPMYVFSILLVSSTTESVLSLSSFRVGMVVGVTMDVGEGGSSSTPYMSEWENCMMEKRMFWWRGGSV